MALRLSEGLGVNAAVPAEVSDVRPQPSRAFWLLQLVPGGLVPNPEVSEPRRPSDLQSLAETGPSWPLPLLLVAT